MAQNVDVVASAGRLMKKDHCHLGMFLFLVVRLVMIHVVSYEHLNEIPNETNFAYEMKTIRRKEWIIKSEIRFVVYC